MPDTPPAHTNLLPEAVSIKRRDLVRFDLARGMPAAIEVLRKHLSPTSFLKVMAAYARVSLEDPLATLSLDGWPPARERLVRHQLRAAVSLDMALERALAMPEAERLDLLLAVISETGARFIESFLPLPDMEVWHGATRNEREAYIEGAIGAFFNAEVDAIHAEDEQLGFDVCQCRFVQLTHQLGRAHLATMFCAADSVFFAREGAPVRLERTGTLATGAPRCDFRFHYT
jgi:hypothetical protein